jgi:hypothetical protein
MEERQMSEREYGGYPESCLRQGYFQLEGEQCIAIVTDLLNENAALREALKLIQKIAYSEAPAEELEDAQFDLRAIYNHTLRALDPPADPAHVSKFDLVAAVPARGPSLMCSECGRVVPPVGYEKQAGRVCGESLPQYDGVERICMGTMLAKAADSVQSGGTTDSADVKQGQQRGTENGR